MKLNVIIPAAGLGRRMKSFGPKALIQIGSETLIERQIRIISDHFDARFVVVAGFEGDRLRQSLPKEVKVVYNAAYEATNVARSIELGLRHTRENVPALVVYGDLVFNAEAIKHLRVGKSAVVMDKAGRRPEEVGVNIVDGVATHFSFGLPAKWAHILLLMPHEKRLFLECVKGKPRHFGYEILNEVIDQGGEFVAITPPKIKLQEIDCTKDLENLDRKRFGGKIAV
jgi:NDP-sugar pyrophosphorylase family protein